MSTPELERAVSESVPDPSPRTVRPLMYRLHFYAGLLVAPFILIAAISGGLYAVAPTIEKFVYSDVLTTDSTGPAQPVADQVRAARASLPELTVTAVRPAVDGGETTRVFFADPTLGESERRAVFIDPVTATPKGELVAYGSSEALPLRTWISQLHRHLHLGEPGRLYSELAASWLWVVALGGLYLWVRRYRTVTSARLATIDRSSSGRMRSLNWHGVTGMWITAALVFLSATGLTWSTYAGENISDLRTSLSWTTPSVDKKVEGGSTDSGGSLLDANVARVDSVLALARSTGIDGKVEVSIPSKATTAFTVAQTRAPWVMSNNTVAIDGVNQRVTDVTWFADWPVAAKLTAWGIQLHMGVLFGLASQIAMAAVALGLVVVIVRGYMMWWKRRPTRAGSSALPRPPARGTWRRIHPATGLAIVVGAVVVGWFAPLLGISLVAFLVVDALLGLRSRTKVDVTP